MVVRAVVFDIGGVLEITPALGWDTVWADRLGLSPAEFYERTFPVWRAGSIGAICEADVHRRLGDLLGLAETQVDALMSDVWTEYLGSLNVELSEYFRGLRPRYRTAILSNSFVGAREREHERYGFGDITDLIVYSHEVGMSKPDPRIYELTCGRLGVRPEEAIFLDDVEPFVDAARQAGMQAILFKNNEQAIADIDVSL
ncbi:HAD-IA family hydrolase [Planosporangium thailandense]|uniref:HAD-IA family hydrolase n=1 Tax=Planosporangium thailandense TaxID=765197 RepID=UPI00197CA4A1